MVEIRIEESDRLDWALKKFKRKVERANPSSRRMSAGVRESASMSWPVMPTSSVPLPT
mgnify:CR=1 FL=1